MQVLNYANNKCVDDFPGRSGFWHRVSRSSRLAEAGIRSGSGAKAAGRNLEESRNKTMISGGIWYN